MCHYLVVSQPARGAESWWCCFDSDSDSDSGLLVGSDSDSDSNSGLLVGSDSDSDSDSGFNVTLPSPDQTSRSTDTIERN